MKRNLNLLSSVYPRDNQAGWKLAEGGGVEVKDGNPVYVDGTGREMVVRYDTIMAANNDAKAQREARQEAENKLKQYEGLDAKVAREAIDKLKQIDAKQLIDVGKVEEVKSQIKSEYDKQLQEKDSLTQQLQTQLDDMQINSVFSQSDFVRNNIAVPQDMFEASFRKNFKVEEGKIIVYDKSGNRLMSKDKVGEFATPEEGLRLLVDSHPQKDTILKANVGSGSGSGGAGGNRGGGHSITRGEFEKNDPYKKAEIMKKVIAGEMKLTD